MLLSWDEKKRTDTLALRALDFADARLVFSEVTLDQIDDRFDYGEDRWITIGCIGSTTVVVIWTERNPSRRIISMRKANANEEARYRKCLDRSG
jgi:uncharacterized protein